MTGDDVFILGEPTAFTPPSAQQQQQTAGLSPGAIAGTVIGAVAGGFLMICLLWLLYVRYGKRRGTTRAAEAAPLTAAADGEEESEDDDGEAEEDDEEDDEAEPTLASASAPRRSPTLVGPADVTPTFAESAAASSGPSLVGPSSLLLPRGPTLTAPPESQVRPATLVPPSEHAVAAAQRLPTLTGPAQTPALGVAATVTGTPTGPSGRVPMQVTLTGPAARASLHGRSSSAGQAGTLLPAAELDAAAAVAAASLAPSARLRLPRPSGGNAAPVATTVDAADVVLTARSQQQPQPAFMLGATPRLSVGGSRGPPVPSPLGRQLDASRVAAAVALGGALPLDGARLLAPAGSPRAASGPLAGARLLASEAGPRTSTRLSASSVAAAAIASSSVRLSIGGGDASARPSAPSAAAALSATAFTAAALPAADSARASLERLAAASSARALAAPAASPRAAATSSPLTRSSSGSSAAAAAAAADGAFALGSGSPVRPLPATALRSAARPPPEPRLSSSSFAATQQPLLFDDVDTGAASPVDGSGASMADLGGRMLQVDGGVVTGRGAAQLDVAPKPPPS